MFIYKDSAYPGHFLRKVAHYRSFYIIWSALFVGIANGNDPCSRGLAAGEAYTSDLKLPAWMYTDGEVEKNSSLHY